MTIRMSHGSRGAKKNARCPVHSSRQPGKKYLEMADVGIGPLRRGAEKVIGHASLLSAGARGGSRLQSARRLVNGGRSVKAAVLAAQSLAQVGDLEAQAQVVCELAREQQATMFATLAD